MTTKMQPAQTYFWQSDYQLIKRSAKQKGVSVAQFLREAALDKLTEKSDNETKKISVTDFKPFSDAVVPADLSLNHDKYIYGHDFD